MDSKRHQQVGELFDAAVELEGDARLQYLDSACHEDSQLRAEVESLLMHHHERTLIPQMDIPRQMSVSLKPFVSSSARGRSLRRWWLLGSKPIASISPRPMLVIVVILTVCLALLGKWVHQSIERSLRQSLESQLNTVLQVDMSALENWIAFEDARVERWAQNEDVRRVIVQLVQISEQPGASRDDLLNSASLAELIRLMEPLHSQKANRGFTVVSRAGMAVADDNLESVGVETSPEGGPYLRRILLGETILIKPSPEGNYVVGIEPDYDNMLMFVAAPVTNDEGDNIAAMVLKFPADEKFTQILSLAQLGETGETYAFDQQADVLSDLRDPQVVQAAGLLLAGPLPAHTALKVQIRDPGGDLTAGYQTDHPRDSWPFTKMAALATAGHDGRDMIGYRNYLGVPVLGAWRWLPEYDFGIATEMTVEEAYAPLRYVRWAFGSLLGLFGLLFGIVLVTSLSHMRLHREVGAATQLGEYTLEELIGQGGMGKVYKARHALLRRPTAIKLLDGVEADRDTVLRFEREVQLTSELTHPNTIQIYDYGRTREEIFYYVMEYLPGLNLGELVAVSGALPAGRVIHLLRQICGSLAEAHQRGLIHRDIKPANIMLSDRGGMFDVIKVLDFGLARSVQSEQQLQITSPQSLGGTPQFLAPERIQDPSILDPRSDIYSLGAVTFFLLAGRHAYTGNSTADLLYQVMNVAPERLRNLTEVKVPSELDALVEACLAKDPEDRPDSMGAILELLDSLAESLPWNQEDARQSWEQLVLQHG
jgi:hypothetical protein